MLEQFMDLDQALAIWKELDHPYGQAATLSNLGLWFRAMGSYQQASKNYRQSLAFLVALGDKPHEAYIRSNLGVVLRALVEDSGTSPQFSR